MSLSGVISCTKQPTTTKILDSVKLQTTEVSTLFVMWLFSHVASQHRFLIHIYAVSFLWYWPSKHNGLQSLAWSKIRRTQDETLGVMCERLEAGKLLGYSQIRLTPEAGSQAVVVWELVEARRAIGLPTLRQVLTKHRGYNVSLRTHMETM